MDLTKLKAPDAIIVSGAVHQIRTGHPYWFRFAQIIEQEKKYVSDFDYLYAGDIPKDGQAGVDELYKFFYEKKELPRSSGDDSGEAVLDYTIDSDLIFSAILQCYGIDLMEKEYHWHKVRAMITGLHETKLNEIIGYRCAKPGKNKELARMKEMWRLPEKITAEDSEAMARFNAQFE